MARCFSCGSELPEKIFRTTTCPSCDKDAKVCLNCSFYEKGAQWDCRERIDEPVRDKDRGNFCAFFVPETRRTGREGTGGGTDKSEEAKKAFKGLFGEEM
jgi:hypothetical protein